MSRLDIKTPSQTQAVVDQLYRNMERRIASSPPGLCPIDMALNFLNLCHAQTAASACPAGSGWDSSPTCWRRCWTASRKSGSSG